MRELREVISEFSSNYEYHFDKLLLRLPRESYVGINPAILIASAVIAYHQTKMDELKPFPDAMACLEKLHRTDIILGVITQGPTVKQAEKAIRLGIFEYISPSALFISDQIGIGKPNVKLFMRACREMDIWPLEAMYVGDNPTNDVDPPNQLGMSTVLLRREGSKYASVQGVTTPDHTIRNFGEFEEILHEHYGIDLNRA
jgi:putative hydrolase of the HAD superfamily